MTKKLAIINDLSGLGRCSLTAAISVTSSMGVQACPLPTAILSAQTGFPHYKCYDFTQQMTEIHSEWKSLGVHFDGIYSGFVSNEAQIDNILDFIRDFRTENTFLLVDPVMGDDGNTYDMFTPSLLEKMTKLSQTADIITPNFTELCLLTSHNYSDLVQIKSVHELLETIHSIGKNFCQTGPTEMVVTGIHYVDETGVTRVGNSYINANEAFHTSHLHIGGSYSGTGDLFASCLAAGMAKGMPLAQIMKIAGDFLQTAIQDSFANNVPFIEGVNFEKFLYLLK
ncbi:MAG: pyridoxamine kinase [Eubacteriales bacterium]